MVNTNCTVRTATHNGVDIIILPYDDTVKNLIPHAKHVKNYLIIPHKNSETKLLYNLGYRFDPPLSSSYDWCGLVPFKHQRATVGILTLYSRAYVLNDMGTGKTLSVLLAFDYLKRAGLVNKMLVVAPLSTLTSVWEQEVFRWMPNYECVTLHGTKTKRIKSLNEDADIYVINHDGVAVIKDALAARGDIDLVVLDELTVYRNATTKRWKVTNKLLEGKTRVWGLTGRPTPTAPTDAWGQARLITPSSVPKYFKRFKEDTMQQVSTFKWIPRPEANGIVHAAMQPSVRFKMEDCIDLPPVVLTTHEVELTKSQTHVYKELYNKLVWQYSHHEVTAANEGVKMSKLLQISCGFAYTQNGGYVNLGYKPRLETVQEIIDGTEQKVIIFVPFRHAVNRLYGDLCNPFKAARIHGGVSKTERDRIFSEFQNNYIPRVIVAHPGTMAHGVTLTAASTIIWFSPPVSLEIYEQANARIRRPGQKNTQHIIHIESTPIERRVYNRLATRQKVQGSLLEMFE